jgi:cytochrome P450
VGKPSHLETLGAAAAEHSVPGAAAAAFDLKKLSGKFLEDPYPTYHALRQFDPVHRMPDGSYFLTRYDDCLAVYRDTETWSSDKKLDFRPNFSDSVLYEHHTTSLVFNDPPYHTRVRKLLAPAFTPRALRALQDRIEKLVDRLLEAAADKGEIDLITDFAAAIPVQLIGDMLGIPQNERKPLRGWSLAILGALEPVLSRQQFDTGVSAVADFKEYLNNIIASRLQRGNSDPAEVLSKLIGSSAFAADGGEGERLSKLELIHNCIFLLNAGHETTTNLIGNAVDLLIRHPHAMSGLRDHRTRWRQRSKSFCGWKAQTSSAIGAPSRILSLAASIFRPGLTCISASAPPIGTRTNFPIRIASTSGVSRTGISPSRPAFTPAPGCRSPAWKRKSQSAACWNVLPASNRPTLP